MRAQASRQGLRKPAARLGLDHSKTQREVEIGGPTHKEESAFGASLLFWIFIVSHTAVWTLVPTLRNHNLPLDVIEHLAWGREWQFGYHKHPPMVSWMLEATIWATGRHDIAVYALSQLAIIIAFIAIWRIARVILPPMAALAALLLSEGVIYHTYTSPEFNVNIASIPFWGIAIASAFKLYTSDGQKPLTGFWILLGLAMGGAVLAKYTSVMLGICLAALLLTPAAWHWWRKPGPYIALAVFGLVITPHIVWLVLNDFPTFSYALARGADSAPNWTDHAIAPFAFVVSQLPAVAAAFVIAALAWPWAPRLPRLSNRHDVFLLIIGFGPIAVLMIIALIFAFELRAMWGSTLFLTLGLMILTWGRPNLTSAPLKRLAVGTAGIAFVAGLVYAVEPTVSARVLDRGKRTQFPGIELAAAIESGWADRFDEPLALVVGDEWLAGNVSYYGASRPSAFLNADVREAPWASLDQLRADGGVVLWMSDKRGTQPVTLNETKFADLAAEIPALEEQAPLQLPWAASDALAPVIVGWAIIPPPTAANDQ